MHNWDLCGSEAIKLQKRLAGRVKITRLRGRPELAAGLDCAFSKDGQRIIACVVVVRLRDFEIIESRNAIRKVKFPYVPGLLSFREAPVCIAAARKLKTVPDVFIVDGQGIAHPRRLGLASHLGLFFDRPTVGCAKSRLVGTYQEPAAEKGAYSFLKDKRILDCKKNCRKGDTKHDILRRTPNGGYTKYEIIGAVVRTRTNVKPVFVSVGNKCLLKEAVDLCLGCAAKYRLPEPTRLAHQLVGKMKLKV